MDKTRRKKSLSSGKKRVAELRRLIEHHNELYYEKAAPEISDREYDTLYQELLHLEEHSSASPHSPTQHVGGKPLEGFRQVQHLLPMQSLANTYSEEEVLEFINRLQKLLSQASSSFTVEPKVDGVAIALLYEKGHFVRAATRGDGSMGDDVTQNILTIQKIPRTLPKPHPEIVEIRGEVYLSHAAFATLNKKREENGEVLFANPRNAAAGSLKQLDAKIVATRGLEIIVYGVGAWKGKPQLQTHMECLSFLKAAGFPTPPRTWKAESTKEILAAIHELEKLRHRFPFETDGAVIKVNHLAQREIVGSTAKAPRWAIAFKYEPERAETLLRKITVQVGRTGVLTPVAELEPVLVSGSTVSRATLHNEEEIARKDIREGDHVLVEKAGEVIPAIVGVRKDLRKGRHLKPFHMPKACPSCHQNVHRIPEQVAVRCINPQCPAQMQRLLEHFSGRGAMDIEGLGEAVIAQLLESGLVKKISDIYTLKKADLLQLERMGEKSAENLLSAIHKSKTRPLWKLIFGLGILNVGTSSARVLADKYGSLSALAKATAEELQNTEDVGAIVASSIREFFTDAESTRLLRELEKHGVQLVDTAKPKKVNDSLAGSTWVLTGTLSISREEAADWIRMRGGHVSSSVSKKTTYLLAGKEPGSKLEKAQHFKVRVLDEKDFRKMLSK